MACSVVLAALFPISAGAAPLEAASDLLGESGGFDLVSETRTPALVHAQVEVRVGPQTFTGTTDAQGRLSISIQCDSPGDLAYVLVTGTGDQADIEMARILSGCAEMEAQALGTGVFQAGPVNPVSTALYTLVRWFEDRHEEYSWPLSSAELTAIRYLLGGAQASTIATALDYWAAGFGPRPSGFDSGLQLVMNRSALIDYVESVEQHVSADDREALLLATRWDQAQFLQPPLQEPPAVFLTSCSELQVRCDNLFELGADQSGQFATTFLSGLGEWLDLALQDVIFADTFAFSPGNLRALQFEPADGQVLSFFETPRFVEDPDGNFVQTPWRNEAIRAYLRILDASDIFPLLGRQFERRQFYPEFPGLGVTTTRDSFTTMANGLLDWSDRPSWTGPEQGQQWALPLLRLEDDYLISPFDVLRVQFDADGVALVGDTGESASWEFAEQVLSLDIPSLGVHHYYFMGGLPNRHQVVVVDAVPGDPQLRRSATKATIPATSSADWDAAEVPGRYIGGFNLDNWLPSGLPEPADFFVLDLHPGGTGLWGFVNDFADPAQGGHTLSWEIDDEGGLVILRQFDLFEQWRRWQLLNEVPNSDLLYLLETQPLGLEFDQGPPEFREYRIQFYKRLDLPD